MGIPGLNGILSSIAKNIYRGIKGRFGFKRKLSRYRKYLAGLPVVALVIRGKYKIIEPSDFRDVHFIFKEATQAKTERRSFKELQNELINKNSTIMIVGEAGIGKTTLCSILSKNLASDKTKKNVIPILISLPNLEESTLKDPLSYDVPVFNQPIGKLLEEFKKRSVKIILLLDGLNELSEKTRMMVAAVFSSQIAGEDKFSLIATSRTIGVSQDLCSRFGKNLQICQMDLWDTEKVRSFIAKNRITHNDSFEDKINLSDNILEFLRLPLLAFLFVQIDKLDSNQLFSEASLFESYLNNAMQNINHAKWIQELAFKMTLSEHTAIPGYEIQEIIDNDQDFRKFCLKMRNEGVFKIPEYASIDERIDAKILRRFNYMFYHQSLQEYLTALYILNNDLWSDVPEDLSTNAFWQEIPLQAMNIIQLNPPQDEEILIQNFLDHGDFLTAARLANKLKNDSIRLSVLDKINIALLDNLSNAHSYASTTKAFQELGTRSTKSLLNMIENSKELETIIAVPEFHLFDEKDTNEVRHKFGPNSENIEKKWRKLGRTIVILGELGNKQLVELLFAKLHRIRSRHLKYHAFESILLVMQYNSTEKLLKMVSRGLNNLNMNKQSDPIINAYLCKLFNLCKKIDFDGKLTDAAQQLSFFLTEKLQNTDDPNFNNEFWRRAHGFLVLAEISSPSEIIVVSELGLKVEGDSNSTPYKNVDFKGYHAVLPAIVTGLLRMQNQIGFKFGQIRKIAERMLSCERFAKSKWACSKLEDFLSVVCSTDELEWVNKMAKEPLPNGTNRVIENLKFVMRAASGRVSKL